MILQKQPEVAAVPPSDALDKNIIVERGVFAKRGYNKNNLAPIVPYLH